MALLRSAPRGDKALGVRDWLAAYGAIWILPVPLGLVMVMLSILWRWPFEALGWPIPADTVSAYAFGIGMVVIFVPGFSWLGLIVSVPVVWLMLRLGLGGWLCFAIAGAVAGLLAAAMLGGMAVLAPVGVGMLSALAFRRMLHWLRPAALERDRAFEA
jgi:hypothetical protein